MRATVAERDTEDRASSHRSCASETTLARIRPLFPALGITRIANVTGLDSIGIPVVMVCRPNSRSLAVSQGKGADLLAATVSGVMESVESFHAERVPGPLLLASYNELRFERAVVDLEHVPRPQNSTFDENSRLLWIEGFDLLHRRACWLPYESVHLDFRMPFPAGSHLFFQSSNGLASGNTRDEAISHAICELVERDGSSLWHALPELERRRRRIRLPSVNDPVCQTLLAQYAKANVAAAVWDTTSDVNLPSFDCLIVDRDLDPSHIVPAAFGAGCHPSRAIALRRALTEAAQSRLTSIAGSRDDMDWPGHERAHDPKLLKEIHAVVTSDPGVRSFDQAPAHQALSAAGAVALELDCLRRAGLREALCVDLTLAGFDIPVVKMVIPGLEFPHRMAGYRPGLRARRAAGSLI